jgi:metallo-beta-lactamase family protein
MKKQTDLYLQFIGAAGTVTGSKTLLATAKHKILIDCGLFQGLKDLRALNWQNLPVKASSIEHVILTHAHLDHCGYIPALVKAGFKGKIYCTPETKEIAEIILLDSAKIQTEDAEKANKFGYSKHETAVPLYDVNHVAKAMKHFETREYGEWTYVNDEMKFSFRNSGHIQGSSFVIVHVHDKKIVFSGDLGRSKPLLQQPADKLPEADYLVLESTYGDRIHPDISPYEELKHIVRRALRRGGNIIIPSFAVERAQEVMMILGKLMYEGEIPEVPVYLDSPMGVSVTKIMSEGSDWVDKNKDLVSFMEQKIRLVRDSGESLGVLASRKKKIIIAGSGMITGGRVLQYLEKYISDEKTTVVLVGFQAVGTRGRDLEEGAKEIKFYGKFHSVKADIVKVDSLSSHADQSEMLSWLKKAEALPKKIFLNHGEPHAQQIFRVKLCTELDTNVYVPTLNEKVCLD